MWKEFGLHFLDGDSLSMRADIQRGHYFAAGILNRNRHGAQAVLEFLIDDRVAIAANLPQGLREFGGICDCAFGVALELDGHVPLDEVMRRVHGNRWVAAQWLGLNRATVRKKLGLYHLTDAHRSGNED